MAKAQTADKEIRLGFLVDGGADAGALPVLTEHLLGRPVHPEFMLARIRGCRQYVNDPKRYQGYVRSFQWRGVLGGLVIVDNERDPACVETLRTLTTDGVGVQAVVAVAVEMLEAWLIACPNAWRRVFGQPLPSLAKEPEQYLHPKNEVVVPFLLRHTAHRWLNEELAFRLAVEMDGEIEALKQRCPSFRQFDAALDVIRRHVT
ncbi:MAG: hypothetical protein V9H69_13000 [Anaerolineae bacterium]|jgi:hypothetical protein